PPPPRPTLFPYTRSSDLPKQEAQTQAQERLACQGQGDRTRLTPRAAAASKARPDAGRSAAQLRHRRKGQQPGSSELLARLQTARSEEHTSELQSRENLVC